VISRDGDGSAGAFVSPQRVQLTAGKSAEFTTLVKFGPPRSGLRLRLHDGARTLASHELTDAALSGDWNARERTFIKGHRSTATVLATLGPSPGLDSSLELLKRSSGDEVAAVSLTDHDQLPATLRGYDAIDWLVVTASQDNPLAGMSPPRREALLQWLQLGGRLLLVAGDAAGEILSPKSPWASLLPGQLDGRKPLTIATGLQSFTGEGVELLPPAQIWSLQVPRSFVTLGESGSGSADSPLVVEYPLGMGKVSLILVDTSQPPLAEWKVRPRLLARVISGESLANDASDTARAGGRMTHLGYRDLAGQLRMALDQYADVAPVHFYPVAGALLLYLLLLGPGEYYLLRNAAPRAMHLTWLLFPLLILGFAGGAIALGRASRGSDLKINQIEIVDLDLVRGQERGTFWTALFSPETRAFSLSAKPAAGRPQSSIEGVQLAWQALPGDGLGGVDTELPPLTTGPSAPYAVQDGDGSAPATISELPLAMASSKMFAGAWWGTIPTAADASQLRRGKLREIEGTFRVVAPVPLKNAYLAHGDWIYRAHNELTPGASIDVTHLERKHLEYQFTQRRVLKDKEFATPWNQEEADIPRIIDIMMFHGGVRGRGYTVLSHRYQGELDLTPLIHKGYAVLVGRSDTPAVALLGDDQPLDDANVRRWTWYRVIYPVVGIE
jgi:hypothetical protein